jgi:hypothetical protein
VRKNNNDVKRIERVLIKGHFLVASTKASKLDTGATLFFFGTAAEAVKARTYLIHRRIAAEQYVNWVRVCPWYDEERLKCRAVA